MLILIFFGIIILDQITKILVEKAALNITVIDRLLSFIYTKNEGAAFSLFSDKPWGQTFFLILTPIALACFLYFFIKADKSSKVMRLSLILIISGALGNYIDRISYGYVIDFVSIHFFPAIFNVADISLTFGAILFVFHFLFLDKDALFKKKQTENKESTDETHI